jgi:internalin A
MSKLALQLIAENKRTRATHLDLGNCGLTELPAELGELVWLEHLLLATDWYEWTGTEWERTTSQNQGRPNDLSGGIGPLARLTSLQTLEVSYTQITDLAPLAGLTALQTLHVSGTQITDLAPLAGLTALQTLHVYNTQIADLAPLAGLKALQRLYASSTNIKDLSSLTTLISRGLPVRWSNESYLGAGIYVKDCPLINPPPEIVEQGNDAILNYFQERQQGDVDHLYEAKMLIVGEGGAGKTSLLRRLYRPDLALPTEKETTKGIAIHRHEFRLKNGRSFRLNVWDFGGQEIYHATHQFFLTRRSLYLLVDDTRKDHKSVSDEGFKYWLELIDLFGGRSPVLIFQNEKGGRSKAIDFDGIAAHYSNVKERYAGNLEKATAADQLCAAVEFFAANLSHIGEELPARWIKVRTDIENRATKAPFITQQEYFEIYRRHMDFDRAKALHLSRYLHDLGVFLHFQDDKLLAGIVILQNQWATEAVFRVLDDEIVKSHRGRFSEADCERLWQDSAYADMHVQLLALMKRFELCYEIRDNTPQTWLAPQLLPPAKPAPLADWGRPEDLILRYRYDFLPRGMISRLTVRLHRFVPDPEMAWVTGVLFELGSTSLLAEVLPNGSEIELRSRGPERHALLSVVSTDLDALNDSFEGLRDKVDKRIPCNCSRCRAQAVPYFFEQKKLLWRKEHNRFDAECDVSLETVDVLELLDGIRFAKPKSDVHETALRVVRIFLASSSELRDDRDAFELYALQQNVWLLRDLSRCDSLGEFPRRNVRNASSGRVQQGNPHLRPLRFPLLHQDRQVRRGRIRCRAPPIQRHQKAPHLHLLQRRSHHHRQCAEGGFKLSLGLPGEVKKPRPFPHPIREHRTPQAPVQ